MDDKTFKLLVSCAAGVVILGGAGWAISAGINHFKEQRAAEECGGQYSGLSSSTVDTLESINSRYGGESIADCLARHGIKP